MELDFANLSQPERYKFLTSVVVPRPIAWVTTIDNKGNVNAAPFSFYNVFGSNPGMVVLGIGNRPDSGEPKDTVLNIHETGEFVVNTVTEALAEQMVATSQSYPHGTDELSVLALATTPSAKVAPPRIAAAPVALECKHLDTHEIGGNRLLIGEILHAWIDDALYDPETNRVLTEQMQIVGRMNGPDGYTKTTGRISIERPS